jgi:hypothetical protein
LSFIFSFMEITSNDNVQTRKKTPRTPWWHMVFAFYGWQMGVGESGVVTQLKKNENIDVSSLQDSDLLHVKALDGLLVNEKSLKSFASLLLFVGIIFLFMEGTVRIVAIACCILSIPIMFLGIRVSKKAKFQYQQLLASLRNGTGRSNDTPK